MTILESWQNNIELLKPKNIKTLFLVSVNLAKNQFFGILQVLFSSLVAGIGFIGIYIPLYFITAFLSRFFEQVKNNAESFFLFIVSLFGLLWIGLVYFGVILQLRSSIEKKDSIYEKNYFSRAWVSVLLFTCMLPILGLILFWYGLVWHGTFFLLVIMTTILYSLTFLFFLDQTKNNIVSFFHAVYSAKKMIFFNLPFFLAFLLTSYVIGQLIIFALSCQPFIRTGKINVPEMILQLVVMSLFYYVYLAVIVTFYNKTIYDQRNLYWK